jgi:hypothetical protein
VTISLGGPFSMSEPLTESPEMSPFQAKSDSPLRFVILSVALGHAQVPACGKRLRGRLREELADKGLIFLLS